MADPCRQIWPLVCSSARRLFRERDADLAEQMHAHIATLQKQFCDSSDRLPEQASVNRGDQESLSGPISGSIAIVPDLGGPPPTHPAAIHAITQMEPLPRAVLILCVHYHVAPGEIARRFGTTRRRIRKHLRAAISAIAASRDQTEP